MSRALALACAALVVACAHGRRRVEPRFVCPSLGGPSWVELTTQHFAIASDLRRIEADRLAHELETARAWVLAAIFPTERPGLETRVRVVAFRTHEEFDEFAPPDLRAYFTRDGLGEPVVVMPPELGKAGKVIVAHELTHVVAARLYPRQPRWFAEGLAALAESMADDAATFGSLPEHRARGYRRRKVPIRELLRWDGKPGDGRYHDASAVLVHYLMDREPERLSEVRRRLAAAADPDLVWSTVFPAWAPEVAGGLEALDEALGRHARAPSRPGREVPVDVQAEPFARTMSPGEVHALRLSLTRFSRDGASEVAAQRAEVEEALAEDPDHVVALQVKAALEGLAPLPLARRAARAHPESVRAWLWLASAAEADPALEAERHEALRRAVAVAPESAIAANNLAWYLLGVGRERDALPLAERALRLSPSDPAVLDTYAGALEAVGRCAEALDAAERALELLPEGTPEPARGPWVERASRLRRTCTPAAPRAGAG